MTRPTINNSRRLAHRAVSKREGSADSAHEEEVYHDDACLIGDVTMAGHWLRRRPGAPGLSSHSHADQYEICYISDGAVDWWAEDDLHEVRRGHFYVTRPHERHGSIDPVVQPCELFWVVFRLPASGALDGTTESETATLAADLSHMTARVFPARADAAAIYRRLLGGMRAGGIYGALASRSAFIDLLVEAVAAERTARKLPGASPDRTASEKIHRSLAWMDERLDDAFSITEAARAAGMSVSTFHKRFLGEVGLTPAAHRVRERIRRAKGLLREGKQSVTTIAHDLGFSSSQYFASVFKSHVGVSPLAYRRQSGRKQDAGPAAS